MKTLALLLLIYFLSCRPGRDIPEADMTSFELISISNVQHDPYKPKYSYTWYDTEHGVFYITYSHTDYKLPIGSYRFGLIRK